MGRCEDIDNDCSDVDPGRDDDGIPDSLEEDYTIPGTVSVAELDLDQDGFLSCNDLPSETQEIQYSAETCTNAEIAEEDDCDIFCSLANPNGVGPTGYQCDGLTNVCATEDDLEGRPDGDRDGYLTCGPWGDEDNELFGTEHIYAVVWLKDVDWSQRGSEQVELARTAREDSPTSEAPMPPPAEDSGTEDSAALAADTADERDTADVFDTADEGDTGELEDIDEEDEVEEEYIEVSSNATELEDMIPLMLPRTQNGSVIACDRQLEEQLVLLLSGEDEDLELGRTRLADALEKNQGTAAGRKRISTELLQACSERDDGACTVVHLTLDGDVDEETYDNYVDIPGAFSDGCRDLPEQWIARSLWQHDRILEARQTVVEWECQRMFGTDCSQVDDSTQLVSTWSNGMESAERWLSAVDTWWKELDRFEAETAHNDTFLTCWGDPREPTDTLSDFTGGDCDDTNATGSSANRDNAEGPDDLIGLYLGAPADCSTCLDGIDNNCDGNVDCADPACARCFVGQGVGCSRGEDAPCAQAGCAIATPKGGAFLDRFFAAAVLALFAVLYRRRERR